MSRWPDGCVVRSRCPGSGPRARHTPPLSSCPQRGLPHRKLQFSGPRLATYCPLTPFSDIFNPEILRTDLSPQPCGVLNFLSEYQVFAFVLLILSPSSRSTVLVIPLGHSQIFQNSVPMSPPERLAQNKILFSIPQRPSIRKSELDGSYKGRRPAGQRAAVVNFHQGAQGPHDYSLCPLGGAAARLWLSGLGVQHVDYPRLIGTSTATLFA